MFYNGQIVYDCTTQQPCIAYSSRSRRETHFIKSLRIVGQPEFGIVCPKSIEEAQMLMKRGVIFPAPLPPTHCDKCFNWLTNHNQDGTCWQRGPLV